MHKNKFAIYKNEFLILISIFSIGLILSHVKIFNSDTNPNVVSYNHVNTYSNSQNNIITGNFTATENYLGIVKVRINNNNKLPKEKTVFRIKNILDSDWYHIATVSADQYNSYELYPFGMPVIANSKGQNYIFEIFFYDKTSAGNIHLSFGQTKPQLISQYQFPKKILLEDGKLLVNFILKKFIYYTSEGNTWKVFGIYSIPFFLYLNYLIFKSKIYSFKIIQHIKKMFVPLLKPSVLFVIFCIYVDIFIIRKYSDINTMLFSLLWILSLLAYRYESNRSFGIALSFLTFCPFLLLAEMNWMAVKSAVWAFMFLVVGVMHATIEIKVNKLRWINYLINALSSKLSFIIFIDELILKIWIIIKKSAFISK
ncbi:MAG: hypothetical protein WAV10_03575 [Minisyncoccia bacterium]